MVEQVAQVTLMRVVLPWMIGKAFDRVGDPPFIDAMARRMTAQGGVPVEVMKELHPVVDKTLDELLKDDKFIDAMGKDVPLSKILSPAKRRDLGGEFRKLFGHVFADDAMLGPAAKRLTFGDMLTPGVRKAVGPAVKKGVAGLFDRYDLTAKTWPELTKEAPRRAGAGGDVSVYENADGTGFLKRGAARYQLLVPSYTVTFAFFLVLTVGWLFVSERRQGTLVRLRMAPLSRGEILVGKLIPCYLLSLFQGVFLLVAGKLAFGMSWGPEPLWLLAVAAATAFAATGLAVLVAGAARTEAQVAVYGTLLVLLLAGLSGSLLPRNLMPDDVKRFSYITPHAWALDAYQQLLLSPTPSIAVAAQACGVLLAFGTAFLALAWWRVRLD